MSNAGANRKLPSQKPDQKANYQPKPVNKKKPVPAKESAWDEDFAWKPKGSEKEIEILKQDFINLGFVIIQKNTNTSANQ